MNNKLVENSAIKEIAIEDIGQTYGCLRIIKPSSDNLIHESMKKYGQLSPIILCQDKDNGYELVDGFKRVRAGIKLCKKTLLAKSMQVSVRASKAAIVYLNWAAQSISHIEEALVVQSLHRDDGLSQVEIATLLGRHKSWVCRRISLIDRLCNEAQESIKLGLITGSIGRELAKLPRGNQEKALAAIQKYKLDSRETEKLIGALLSRPRWDHDEILRCMFILDERVEPRPPSSDKRLNEKAPGLNQKLKSLEKISLSVVEALSAKPLAGLSQNDILLFTPMFSKAIRGAELAVNAIRQVLSSQNEPPF